MIAHMCFVLDTEGVHVVKLHVDLEARHLFSTVCVRLRRHQVSQLSGFTQGTHNTKQTLD